MHSASRGHRGELRRWRGSGGNGGGGENGLHFRCGCHGLRDHLSLELQQLILLLSALLLLLLLLLQSVLLGGLIG